MVYQNVIARKEVLRVTETSRRPAEVVFTLPEARASKALHYIAMAWCLILDTCRVYSSNTSPDSPVPHTERSRLWPCLTSDISLLHSSTTSLNSFLTWTCPFPVLY